MEAGLELCLMSVKRWVGVGVGGGGAGEGGGGGGVGGGGGWGGGGICIDSVHSLECSLPDETGIELRDTRLR